jgi:hypothetical protein
MNDAAERRSCGRSEFRRPVVLASTDGHVAEGALVNVSLGGVLVALTLEPGRFEPGQAVELRLPQGSQARFYACEVVRAGHGLIGLSLHPSGAARFVLDITRGLFAQKPAAGPD